MAFITAILGVKFTILSRLKVVKTLSISVIPSNPRSVLTLSVLNLQRNGTNMKWLKSMFFSVSMIALIVLSLPVSLAYNSSPGSVNSPLSEPESVFNSVSDFIVYMIGSFTDGRGYQLGEFHITGLSSSDKFCLKNGFVRSSVQCNINVSVYDISTGVLLGDYPAVQSHLSSAVDSFYWYSYGSIFAQIPNNNIGGLYYITPSNAFINVLGGSYSPPFVEWSNRPVEHNIYHSQLSEPVADEYNSYFICNDRLYWLSYRANGLYTFSQTVELNSQIYEEPVSYSSSGSGTYVGQQNGYTEQVTGYAPYFTGSTGDGTIVTGTLTPPDFGQIDFVGVNQGQLRVNSNGQFTYNDLEVFPVGISNQVLNRLFDVVIYLTDSSGFKVWLVPRSDLGQSLVLAADLYCSVFDLSTGEYVSSSFSSYSGSYQHAGFDFRLDDELSDVRCYGCAFYNVNNVPVNLSDVIWEYDLEFVQWRDNMLDKLTQIYNLLNSTPSTDEPTTYKDFGGEIAEAEPSYQGQVDADQVAGDLDAAINGDFNFGSAASAVRTWVDWFSIPKIIALCVFALATGSVILILGKKKSD